MRLIFIRHGEPDYTTDSLTENGIKEAAALAERTKNWNVDRIFCSPMGRAQETSIPTLKALNMESTTYPWLKEFNYRIMNPVLGQDAVAWDQMPQIYATDPVMYDRDNWFKAKLYKDYPVLEAGWREVAEGIDGILKEYGYTRNPNGAYYDFSEPNGSVLPAELEDIQLHGDSEYELRDEDDEKTIVFFCHFGITAVILAYLIGVSPVVLWQNTCIPTTGVTIVNAEKRLHNAAYWRIQALGDCAHLYKAGVKISGYAAFSPMFQQ